MLALFAKGKKTVETAFPQRKNQKSFPSNRKIVRFHLLSFELDTVQAIVTAFYTGQRNVRDVQQEVI